MGAGNRIPLHSYYRGVEVGSCPGGLLWRLPAGDRPFPILGRGRGPDVLGREPSAPPASRAPQFILHSADGDPLHVATPARAGDHIERTQRERLVVVRIQFRIGRNNDDAYPRSFAYVLKKLAVRAIRKLFLAEDE